MYAPASTVFIQSAPTSNPNSYRVASIGTNTVSILIPSTANPLCLGQRIILPSCIGIVTALGTNNSPNATVTIVSGDITKLTPQAIAKVDLFAAIPPVSYQVVDSTVAIGQLSVVCSIPSFTTAGYMGWSLYLNQGLVLNGNDLNQRGVCSANGGEQWAAGTYTLAVSLFEANTFSLIRSNTRTWVLTAPTSYIGCGNPTDLDRALKV